MHPDMIVEWPVRGTGIPTEGAVGVIHFGSHLEPVDVEGLLGSNPCHGSRVNDAVETDILLLHILGVIGIDLVPVAVHQTPDSQRGGVLLVMGHSRHHGKCGLKQIPSVFHSQGFLIGPFGDLL